MSPLQPPNGFGISGGAKRRLLHAVVGPHRHIVYPPSFTSGAREAESFADNLLERLYRIFLDVARDCRVAKRRIVFGDDLRE